MYTQQLIIKLVKLVEDFFIIISHYVVDKIYIVTLLNSKPSWVFLKKAFLIALLMGKRKVFFE